MATISAARTAALSPRSSPTAATGIPGGICTMERRESMLTLPLTGTPITGLTVNDAIAPGRAAERPAMAMNTSEPLLFTSSSTLPGVLWAEATAISKAIPNLFSISMAFSATGISLLLPMIMDTLDIAPTTALAIDNLAHRGPPPSLLMRRADIPGRPLGGTMNRMGHVAITSLCPYRLHSSADGDGASAAHGQKAGSIGSCTTAGSKTASDRKEDKDGFGNSFRNSPDQLLRTTTRKIPTATSAPIKTPMRLTTAL